MSSTLQLLKEAEYKLAKAVASAISHKQGGILGVRSSRELPRDQNQVYNVRQKRCEKDSAPKERSDVLYYLMEQSRKCFDGVQFV